MTRMTRMTRITTALLAGLTVVTACATPPDPADPPPRTDIPAPVPSEEGVRLASTPPAREPDPIPPFQASPPGTYDQGVDVLHYDIEVAVSDTAAWIAGRTRIDAHLTRPVRGPLGLDFTGLAVDRVTVDGSPVSAAHADGRLRVPLEGAGTGDTVTVEIWYRGVPDDGLQLRRNVHGDPTVFVDNWPNRARFWFPSVDHPSDKATVSHTVHAPAQWQIVGNGALLAEPGPTPPGVAGPAASGDRLSWRYGSDVPHPTYTMVVGGGVMVVDEVGTAACGLAPASARPDGCVLVTTWLFPQDRETGRVPFRRADAMVTYFAERFGPFPYEKLANVQSSTRFGGMENASAIFYSEQALSEGRLSETTVSHEIAHQWFGDGVTEADWHHLWLSEGFATYFGDQFFEVADGPDRFRELMEENRVSYLTSEVTGRPVIEESGTNLLALLNANNYPKGGWVLHMLRGVVGDDTFFRGVREYYLRHMNETALTDDFRTVMEEVSGRDLGWFFHQWLREPGYPLLSTELGYEPSAGEAVVTLRQEQDADWPTFRLPLELEITTGSGTVRERVEMTRRAQTFRVAVPDRPSSVIVDPDGWVLKRTAGEEVD